MEKLVIFGTKAFADLAHHFFTHDSPHRVVGFTVDGAYLREPSFRGLPVVPFEEVAAHFPPDEHEMFVAVGIGKVNRVRAQKVTEAEVKGYRLASFLSSKAHVHADFILRPNTMVMEHAAFHPFVDVGRDSIIWSGSRIALRTRIGDHCWITCPVIGESVTVGDYSFIGVNATIAPFASIGRSNIIGAGALILGDTRDGEVYKGRPSEPSRVPSHRLWSFGR